MYLGFDHLQSELYNYWLFSLPFIVFSFTHLPTAMNELPSYNTSLIITLYSSKALVETPLA